MKTDKFNPILYQKREELQIKKQESRKEFRYLYKSVIANQNTAILLLEDIDEKADLVLKEIAQVVQLKKEINAQLDKLLSYQQKNLEQLKEVHTNFKKIEAPLSKSQYLLMGTSMIQQLEEQQKKKKDVKVQKQLNIDAKLQQEIQIQQKNRDLLKFKLTKIKQELEHRLKDEKYQGENQSPKIQINENNKIVNRMQQRRALTPQSENLSHIQKFFGASSRNQNNHYQSFRKLDRMLTRSRLYSQDEDKSPSRKVAMNVIDEQTPKESLNTYIIIFYNAFGNSYTKGLRVQSKSPNKADSPVLTQKSPLSQFYRNEESQIQRTYFKKNNYVNDKTQKLQQKQEESKQQQLNSEDKMGIFNQSLENLKKIYQFIFIYQKEEVFGIQTKFSLKKAIKMIFTIFIFLITSMILYHNQRLLQFRVIDLNIKWQILFQFKEIKRVQFSRTMNQYILTISQLISYQHLVFLNNNNQSEVLNLLVYLHIGNAIQSNLLDDIDVSSDEDKEIEKKRREMSNRKKKGFQVDTKTFKKKLNKHLIFLQKAQQRIILSEIFCSILGMGGVFFSVLESDEYFSNNGKKRYSHNSITIGYRYLTFALTLILVGLLSYRSFMSYKLHKKQGKNLKRVSYLYSPQLKQLLVEAVVNFVHMPVWFDYEFSLLTKLTQWRNKKAQKFCNEEGIDADTIFSLKCLMQTKPYTVLLISFIILSVMFGFAVRTLERPYYQDDSTGGQEQKGAGYQDYNFMMNGWWLIFNQLYYLYCCYHDYSGIW